MCGNTIPTRSHTTTPLSLYWRGMHGVSNEDTYLHPLNNNSSVLLTTKTYLRLSGRITGGIRSGWITLRDWVLSTPTPAHPPWNDPSKYSANQAQPPLHRWRMLPLPLAQMGHGLFCGFWVGRRRTNHRPCWTPMSNPPNSLWTARPDECAGWDNWMVALPLPKDPTAQAVDSDNSLNRRRGGLLTSWFTRWLQGFTLIFLFSKIMKTFIHHNAYWQVAPIYVASSYVLYVFGRVNYLKYVRGCACVLFCFHCVKPLVCFFASCGPCGWNKIIKNEIKKQKLKLKN